MLYTTVSNYSAVAGIYEITYHTARNMGNFTSYVSIYLHESGKTIQKKVTAIGLKMMPSTHIKNTKRTRINAAHQSPA